MWFNNLKIRSKLIILIAVMVVCMLGLGIYSLAELVMINTSYTDMGTHYTLPMVQIQTVVADIRMLRINTLQMCNEINNDSDIQSLINENTQLITAIESLNKDFESTIVNDSLRQAFAPYITLFNQYKTQVIAFHNKVSSHEFADSAEAFAYQVANVGTAAVDLDSAAIDLQQMKLGFYNAQDDANDVLVARTILVSIIVLCAAVALLLIIGLVIASVIARPLRKLVTAANRIALGDVDVELDQPTKDETGMLVRAFTSIVDNTKVQVDAIGRIAAGDLTVDITPRCDKDAINISLKRMLEQNNGVFNDIMSSSSQVSTASTSMADGAQALAQGTTEQASAIEQLSQTVSHITEQTKMNADNANNASSLTDAIRQRAEQGDTQMRSMLKAMTDINEASARISSVIKVIDEIAFQTNILALNASVEAARAGQSGKGFAVVAEEVKNLATKSTEAARDTTELIESSIRKAEEGTDIAKETSQALTAIVQGIIEANGIIKEIAASSNNEAVAIEQVNIGISQISEVVQVNSATAEESAAASQQISAQAQLLKELIGQFKLVSPSYTVAASPAKRLDGGAKTRVVPDDDGGFGKY